MDTSKRHYVWYGHASSEGGPLLVADLDVYPAWRGAVEAWSDDASYRVHYYGPLIAKLPERLRPSGDVWHQFACRDGIENARAYVRELRAEAERIEPRLAMRAQKKMDLAAIMAKARGALAAQGAPLGEGTTAPAAMSDWLSSWRDHIEGGADFYAGDERVLHLDAKPDTDYARACEAIDEDAAIVAFGENESAKGVAWSLEGPGTGRVAVAKDAFLVMRASRDDEDKHERNALKWAATASDDLADIGPITFTSGRIAIVWAPVAPSDLVSSDDPASALRAAAALNPPVQLNQSGMLGVGTLVSVPPGTYRITCGVHEAEEGDGGEWTARFIRFVRE